MFFKIEGEEATKVLQSIGGLVQAATNALNMAAKKWDWEAHILEANAQVTDEEIRKHEELKKLEYEARLGKAKAEMAESLVRQRRASLQQQNLNRVQHKPKDSNRGNNHERRNAVQGEREGKNLTQNLGDKLKAVTTPS